MNTRWVVWIKLFDENVVSALARCILQLIAQPVQTLIQPIPRSCASRLEKIKIFILSTSLVLTWMYQFLFLRLCRPSLSVISAAFIALGRSCLLAKMRRTASLNSSSANIRISSSLASPILSLTNDILKYKQISSWHTLNYLKVVVGVLSSNCLIYFPY